MLGTEDYIKYKLIEEDIERCSSNNSGGSDEDPGWGFFILIFIVLALLGWFFS